MKSLSQKKVTKILIGLVIALSLLFLAYPNATFAADSDEKQSVTIQATKLFKGGTLTGGDFTYKLTPTSYTGTTLTTTNDAEGNIKFTVEYTDDDIKWEDDTTKETGYLIYKMQEVKGNNNSIRYDDNECYAVVKVERTETSTPSEGTTSSYQSTVTYAKANYVDYEYEEEYAASTAYHATEEELAGQAYAVYNSKDESLIFFRDDENKYTDKQKITNEDGTYLEYYTGFEDGNSTSYHSGGYNAKSVIFQDAIRPKKMMFDSFYNCTMFDLEKLDTSEITDMNGMFQSCRSIETINISTFDTSNVTTMYHMFNSCTKLKVIILGDLNTRKVTTTDYMFNDTKIEQINLAAFETDSLEHASAMLSFTSTKKADMSTWKTNESYNTDSMFAGYEGEYIDLSSMITTYSADITTPRNLRILKVNNHEYAGRATLFNGEMINTETGKIENGNKGYSIGTMFSGTYVTMTDTEATFTNFKRPSISIKKVDPQGRYLPGARMGLMMGDGLLTTWITGNEPHILNNLKPGENYSIVEIEAPEHYKNAEKVSFTVTETGEIIYNNQNVSEITIADEIKSVEIQKIWNDEGYEDLRPDSITFDLYDKSDMNTILETVTLNKRDYDSNTNIWNGLFNYDKSRGKYLVVERDIPHYNKIYKGKKDLSEGEYLNVNITNNSRSSFYMYWESISDSQRVNLKSISAGETYDIVTETSYFYLLVPEGASFTINSVEVINLDNPPTQWLVPYQVPDSIKNSMNIDKYQVKECYGNEPISISTKGEYYYCYLDETATPVTNTEYIKNTFVNPTGKITFEGKKSISTREIRDNETFEFEISDGENTWTATIDERGNIEYPEILYTLRDVGKHTYTVKEKTANIPGLINDPTVYTVTVEVIDDGDDTLEIKASENYKLLNFVNEESKITIRKEDFTSKTTLEGAKYTISGDNLKGVRVGGKEITETDLKDGSYTFEGASVEIVGLYDGTYTLKEVTSPEGYTTISEFTFEIENGVIVKVTAGTDGDATYSEDGKILTVYNKKIPEPVKDKDEEEAEEEPEEKIQEKQETISPQTGDHVLIYVIGLVLAVIGMFNLKRK